MFTRISRRLFLAPALMLLATPAFAQAGELQLFALGGATTGEGTSSSFTLGAAYGLTDSWSVRLDVSRVDQKLNIPLFSIEGELFWFVGSERRYPVSVAAIYQPGDGRFRPFVGAGLTWADDLGLGHVPGPYLEDLSGLQLIGGIDIEARPNTFFRLDFRTTHRTFQGFETGDTLSAGVNWRF